MRQVGRNAATPYMISNTYDVDFNIISGFRVAQISPKRSSDHYQPFNPKRAYVEYMRKEDYVGKSTPIYKAFSSISEAFTMKDEKVVKYGKIVFESSKLEPDGRKTESIVEHFFKIITGLCNYNSKK